MDSLSELVFNGIDGSSGSYLVPPLTPAILSAVVRGENQDPSLLGELKRRHEASTAGGHFGLMAGIDATDLAETGWGVIFPHDVSPALKEVLGELIAWRREQATSKDERLFRVFAGPDGYRPGETKSDFLTRHGVGPGPADPAKIPYYLLIVGDPEEIPFRFQSQLDVQYAVGRIHFEDLEDFARYARSVVQVERERSASPRKVTFFGVQNTDDRATELSAQELIKPLGATFSTDEPDWEVETVLGDQASKDALTDRLGGPSTPGLIFTASHGMGFPYGDSRQFPHQGALLCQDWPGPVAWRQAIPEDFYFSADDLGREARLLGLIAFHFACYGGGTPRQDEFAQQAFKVRSEIAPRSFLARLPQRMLSHPNGGALAVVGHVERAWGYSFAWGRAGRQLGVFESALKQLLHGYPVGAALEFFNERYAEISTDLSVLLEDLSYGKEADDLELAGLWTANNDARNYMILGDPAVRLVVSNGKGEIQERPIIVSVKNPPPSDETVVEKPAEVPPPPLEASKPGELALDYGLGDIFRQAGASLGDGLQNLVSRLSEFLGKALDDAASLEIATYVSENLESVRYQNGRFKGAQLRALTHIKVDGDTLVCVPEDEGTIDTELWRIHLEMMRQAQASRAELLKTAVEAVTGLAGLLKP